MNEDERNTSMQFCQECNNLMYPREVLDRDNPQDSRLVYTCKSPNCIEKGRPRRECKDAESTLVWKHVVQHSMKVDDLINADIVNDPTLPRTQQVHCPEVRLRSPLLRNMIVPLHARACSKPCRHCTMHQGTAAKY